MTMLERDLQRMLNSGASYEAIKDMLEQMEEKEKAREEELRREAARKAEDAKVTAARTKLIEATGNYMMALGWMTEAEINEVDFQKMEEHFKAMENYVGGLMHVQNLLSDWDPVHEENKPVKINLPGMNPMMGTVKITEAPVPMGNEKRQKTDDESIEAFLKMIAEGRH